MSLVTTETPTPAAPPPRRPKGPRRRRLSGLPASRTAAVVGFAALLVLTACDADDDEGGGPSSTTTAVDDDAQAYVDATAAALTADEELPFDQDTATCISTALVDVIGADALAQAGVTPEEFADAETYEVLAVDIPDDAEARLGEALGDCDLVGAFTSVFAEELGVELAADDVACLGDHVDGRTLTDAFASGAFASADEGQADIEAAVQTTFVDAVVACPPVVTALFLAEAPGTVTPETEACVAGLVEADPDRVRAAINGDTAAAEELGAAIGSTCSGTLQG